MDSLNPPPLRVLARPPSRAPTSTGPVRPPPRPVPPASPEPQPPPLPPPQTQPQPQSRSPGGVTVVGFVSRNPDHSSQLINRVIDSNAFGSGNLDKVLLLVGEEVRDWFSRRRISYYHDEERGFLFLQFLETRFGHGSGLDESELEDLQGLLFMFSVCHEIIYILEGSRVDTHIFSKLRVLQGAKHSLVPYFKSKSSQALPSRAHPASSSSMETSSNTSSRGRTGGGMSRSASSVSMMSGSGSHASLYPGCCTPVILFVFVDDFPEGLNAGSNVEESTDGSHLNHSSSLSNATRSSLPTKGSGSVVVLARPAVKSEGGARKKMQSSMEAQIRFLIKKCRILLGSEVGHGGSRGGGVSNSAPLFSLDASRVVVLLDRCTVQGGESLDFATKLVDEVLNGKATLESLLLESNVQSANKEDVSLIKEFLLRQSDILRGRGGFVAGGNGGSAGGVGMAAVAAAAAAASAASAKTFSVPELPSFDTWLSNSQQLLHGLLSAKRCLADDMEFSRRQTRQRNVGPGQAEGIASRGIDPVDLSVSLLEKATGLNSKFSTSWCERALPTAKEIYLRDLPPCYPTSVHENHLGNALRGFYSMVRGPAVQMFAKRLEDECTNVWISGRQLCDVVSLTGKPCMHQRHDVSSSQPLTEGVAKSHCSGYFFLHACACGRSRQLRPDPFSFEFANASNCFPDCDKGLPLVQLQANDTTGPVQSSSWTLIRVGGARYYEPSKGLIQSGFSTTHKFLSRWVILLEKPTNPNGFSTSASQLGSVSRPMAEPHLVLNSEVDRKKVDGTKLFSAEIQTRISNQTKQFENGRSDEKKISFGMGLPNLTMRKPFSEVVAGSSTRDSGFPPLQQRRHPTTGIDKSIKQNRSRDPTTEQVHATHEQGSQKSEDVSSSLKILNGPSSAGGPDGDPLLRIGSNVVPMNINSGIAIKSNPIVKHAVVYFGFEHECPHGHRFLLNEDHLSELGSTYSLQKESDVSHLQTSNQNPTVPSSLGRKGGRGKVFRNSGGMNVATGNRMRNAEKLKEIRAHGADRIDHLSGTSSGQSQRAINASVDPNRVKDLGTNLQSLSMDDGGSAVSMLNRNIPVFMNCPYCRLSKGKKDPKIKFAGTISQLQRIFLVTPPFPVVLAISPVIQFEASCLPPSVVDREQKLQFTIGSQVVLPPESFLTLRLPFIYGVQLEDGRQHPLGAFEHQPETTAWIVKGTALNVVSKQNNLPQES
ncbi:Nonsense-mediated mRNA decay factor SMG8 [Linum perenne]